MKSPMIENASYIKDKHNYTELQVCKSGAGWYIGTMHTDEEFDFQEPGSRDSGYYPTPELAQADLDKVLAGDFSLLRIDP